LPSQDAPAGLLSSFTASCVSGVTVVTQKPPVVTLRKGETATMDCNLGTVTDSAARWYKQTPGGVPQYILFFYHGDRSAFYGYGFYSPKFTSNHQSTSDYRLIINNVEEGDSAVYYCHTWDDSAKEELIVTGSGLSPPVLTVFPPSSAELQSNKATLLCLSSQSVPVSSGTTLSKISSYLDIQTSDWNMEKLYTCKVSLGSQTSEKNINKSACPTEQ
uniref:Ig-like domain-containing protein n=1 Tax=Seriola dumerili TaxID=41447 RepID=A0A3B4UH20_SERDU